MSNYHWQAGTVKLPATEFAGFRKALADLDLQEKTALFEHAHLFWKGLTAKEKADPVAYRAAFTAYETANSHQDHDSWNGRRQMISDLPVGLQRLVGANRWYQGIPPKPARVLKDAMGFPTNRTTVFTGEGHEAVVTFDKAANTVRWAVPENNGAVDVARQSALAMAFFRHLDTVQWTRGTGGTIVGNDAYHTESDGGEENYVSAAFGPLGADAAPDHTHDYIMSDGTVVRRQDFPEIRRRSAELSKEERRVSAGVQGRLGAGNGSKSGEFLRKGQSLPEVKLRPYTP